MYVHGLKHRNALRFQALLRRARVHLRAALLTPQFVTGASAQREVQRLLRLQQQHAAVLNQLLNEQSRRARAPAPTLSL
eukprot:4546408-Pleurochrysis_carterae.AAC.1